MNISERCDNCDSQLIMELTPELIHYGRIICKKCGKWYRWVTNPDKEKVRTKTSKYKIRHIIEYRKITKAYCFFCLRTQKQLGEKETLTIDHIEELGKGGEDKIWNLQILCTACHKLKNWARLYMHWHLKK